MKTHDERKSYSEYKFKEIKLWAALCKVGSNHGKLVVKSKNAQQSVQQLS
jgi:hypothetical protein